MPPSKPPPPPPPKPLPPSSKSAAATTPAPKPPHVAPTGPSGAFLVELLIFNGSPFKDHWGYWVCSRSNPNVGMMVHATGDVRNGFKFEVKRSLDFDLTTSQPSTRVPLTWIDGKYFDEKAMFNNGVYKCDNSPACVFEASAYKVKAPEKSLNAANDSVCSPSQEDILTPKSHPFFPDQLIPVPIQKHNCYLGPAGKKVTQRNCQTWIVESADQLARDRIFSQEVVSYLYAIKQ